MSEIKLCVDCRHNMPESDMKHEQSAQRYAKCGRKINPGSGLSDEYCSIERTYPARRTVFFVPVWTGYCGKEGRFWEPKA